MTANVRVSPHNDWDDATLTVSIAAPIGFEITNTQNTDRSDVYQSATTATVTLSATWPTSRVASVLYLFRHLLAGANVRLQLFTDAAWTTAASPFSDSGTVSALCYSTTGDAYTWSTGTKDPFESESPYWLHFAETSYQSAKLTLSGTPTFATFFQICRVFLGRYYELAINPDYGLTIGRKDLSRATRTDGGTRRAHVGASYRVMVGTLNGINANELALWMALWRQAGTSRDFAISGFPGDGTSKEALHTMNGSFTSLDVLGHEVNRFTAKFQVEEY